MRRKTHGEALPPGRTAKTARRRPHGIRLHAEDGFAVRPISGRTTNIFAVSFIYPIIVIGILCFIDMRNNRGKESELHIEKPEPFTGKQKLVDTAGRVERFRRKYAKSDAATASK